MSGIMAEPTRLRDNSRMASTTSQTSHQGLDPSPWVTRWAPLVRAGGDVLDVACGGGRHARHFAARGHPVLALDRDAAALAALAAVRGVSTLCADIENGPWPLAGRRFDAVVVINYLHRPLFPLLLAALAPGGVLIYETFALGNERHGRPSNPAYLLGHGELLDVVRGHLEVIAYEDVTLGMPRPACVQRICAVHAEAVATNCA
jgi:SAM-dependent methyltransferase